MPSGPLTRDDLIIILHELADALNAEGVKARFYIVGGAAMVLGYSARDATRDVDAQYYPKADINRVAADIAKEHHLPSDWLNDNAAIFISPVTDDNKRQLFLSKGSVTIQTASAEALLAMKIRASRPRMDNFDIAFLCEYLEVTSIAQAVGIYETYYPEDPLPRFALPILQAILRPDKEATNPSTDHEVDP
ncbi:MAG: DUF6036 family nucleotidyltransferase [Ferrimicrobium sp.]